MTTREAIGATSASIRALLSDRLESPPGLPSTTEPVPVGIGLPPDDGAATGPLVNLFLYRVTENPWLKNQEIPGRGAGNGYGHPPLSLRLHYLVTTYGAAESNGDTTAPDERVAHYLLGDAMRILHDYPVITENLVTEAGDPILDDVLAGEYERIKITLEPLGLEEISKIWTALNRPYRLSTAYEVGVVQIESDLPQRIPKPVGELPAAGPRITMIPSMGPAITEVRAEDRPAPYAAVGERLVIEGANLGAPAMRAFLGEVDASDAIESATDTRLTVRIPDDPALQPGTHAIRLRHEVLLGDPPSMRGAARSNTAAFVLVPKLSAITPDLAATPVTLTLEGMRLFAPNLHSMVVVGSQSIPVTSTTTPTPTQVEVTVELPPLDPGEYPVRARVNGIESIDPHLLVVT